MGGEDTTGFNKEMSSIRALREKHVEEAPECGPKMFAKLVSLSRPRRRWASTSTHSKTSPASLTAPRTLWARSPDNVLSRWQYEPSHFCSCWARKNGGSRTIAILHTAYRFTMRLVSAHISQWDIKFAGEWLSALKAGIKLSHSEGQYV